MGNCLVTKLKESVQNDNLEKLDTYSFTASARKYYFELSGVAETDCKLMVYDNATRVLLDTINLSGTILAFYTFTTDSHCEIKSKYGLSVLLLDQLSKQPGDEDIKYMANLEKVYGEFNNISSFGNLTKIIDIGMSKAFINGEVLELVNSQRNNGRSSCNGIQFRNGHIRNLTLNGNPTEQIEVVNSAQYVIWEPTYIIVANAALTSATKVMTYGMTDGEIATLQSTYPNITTVIKCD